MRLSNFIKNPEPKSNTKKCSKCGELKLVTEFSKNQRMCKLCNKDYREQNKERVKDYYEQNKEKLKEQAKDYREQNKEKLKEQAKDYYEQNKEKLKEQAKDYREQNKERVKDYREQNKEKLKEQAKDYREQNKERVKDKAKDYYEQNKERVKDKAKDYYEQNKEQAKEYYEQNKERVKEYRKEYEKTRLKTDPYFKFTKNLRHRIGQAFKLQSKNGKTKACAEYGIDFAAIYEHIGQNPDGKHHLDHIIPLSVFDLDVVDHVRLAHLPENLRWLPGKDNLEKSDFVDWNLIKQNHTLFTIAILINLKE